MNGLQQLVLDAPEDIRDGKFYTQQEQNFAIFYIKVPLSSMKTPIVHTTC